MISIKYALTQYEGQDHLFSTMNSIPNHQSPHQHLMEEHLYQ